MSPPSPTPQSEQAAPSASVCALVGALFRLAVAVLAVLGVLAGAAELALRAAGAKPAAAAERSNVVPDGWTGFRLRPGVSGEEAFVTNDLGMHSPRSYALARPPGTLRVAVLGSSVVYGLATRFADTIPGVVERELQAAGHRAEVLNFGTHAFTIVNLSALLQAYVHQFQPDVVVVVVDLQVGLPRWPAVHPATGAPSEGIQTLGPWEALLSRGARTSALLSLLDDPRPARRWLRRATGLPLQPRPRPPPRPPAGTTTPPPPLPGPAVPTAHSGPTPSSPQELRAYEESREGDLAAPMAAMAAFSAEKAIDLYFVTPYGPYFDLTEDDLARMSVHHLLEEAARVRGSERAALGAEVELITRVARRVTEAGPAHLIDMLEASRRASLRSSPDFTEDGVHLSPAGNAALGRLIATRIVQDIQGRPGGGR
jgi:hypothetical protein